MQQTKTLPFTTSSQSLIASVLLMMTPACTVENPQQGQASEELATPSTFRTTTTNYTSYQSGDVPILISVPHGGSDEPASLTERTTSYSGLVTNRELYLQDIAIGVADRLENTHGITPYLVLGDVHRKYIDYNRDETAAIGGSANEAYETSAANTYYDEYHSRLDSYISTIQSSYTNGLLIDMHGTGSVPNKIVRGTRNGDAIWDLLRGHNVTSITASEEKAGHTAAMAQDDDLGTYWSSAGDESIEFDLGSTKTIGSVELAMTNGSSRTYDFEIEVWTGSSWTVAFDGNNTGGTSDFEIYEFSTPISGSKVRISCHGSDYSSSNYIKEIRIQEHGWDPILGPNSIFDELDDAGYTLEPGNTEYGVGVETTFIGGFTVEHHGSENGGLDAVQIEIGSNYRDTQSERDQLIIDIADAIDSYYDNY